MCDLVHWLVWILFLVLIVIPVVCWAVRRARKNIESIKDE